VRPISPLVTSPLERTLGDDSDTTQSNEAEAVAEPRFKLNEQQSFLLFVKIFSFYIVRRDNNEEDVQHNEASSLKQRFKAIITKCTTENRRRNPDFMPLQSAVEHRLRNEMGEQLWSNAVRILHGYCQRQRIQLSPSISNS
jgi:hypothetical protein